MVCLPADARIVLKHEYADQLLQELGLYIDELVDAIEGGEKKLKRKSVPAPRDNRRREWPRKVAASAGKIYEQLTGLPATAPYNMTKNKTDGPFVRFLDELFKCFAVPASAAAQAAALRRQVLASKPKVDSSKPKTSKKHKAARRAS